MPRQLQSTMLPASPHSASLHMKIYPACNGSVMIVDYTRKSGDGGFADESGEELELKTGQRFDSALVAGFMMLYKLAINCVRYYYSF